MYRVLLFTERPKWRNRWEFFLYTAALLFSPFSVWKFPVIWSQYGGANLENAEGVKRACTSKFRVLIAFIKISWESWRAGRGTSLPWMCLVCPPAACLLPYLVCMLSVGLPLVCLELSLGQFMQRSGPRVWAVVPMFKGLCATSTALVVLKASTNLVLAAWTGCYMYLVLTNQLPACVTDSASPRLPTGEITYGNSTMLTMRYKKQDGD